ncbi:MAG: glycosyl hydrolase family 28-related protein [Pseudomonadota bacterium]
MNKAVTEGLDLMPPAFVEGLAVWSSEDGQQGSETYETNPDGTLTAADPDFGDCLEIVTSTWPQRLRYMGQTPIQQGCYLEVTARVKLVSNQVFPSVRIAALAGSDTGEPIFSVITEGPATQLDNAFQIYTIRAIIGSGTRTGVDMPWGRRPVFAHVGLDILGSPGAVVRVESIRVEDRTSYFHRDLMDWVDVRDFGALGDGVTDDFRAFLDADAAADGRAVLVSEGTYFLGRDITMVSPVRFEGQILQAQEDRLILRSNFDLPTYADAFGGETEGLKKGLQALFNFADHDGFDLAGRTVDLTEPIDVHAVVANVDQLTNRRGIRNGRISATDSGAWDPDVVITSADYDPADPRKLTNVTNAGAIAPGSLVQGFGVGREVFVRDVDVGAREIMLSNNLSRAGAQQSYTFTRFKYMLDFSGFERVSSFTIDGVELDGNRQACGVLLPKDGIWWTIRNCWFTRTGLRAISSPGDACQGISIDQCEFLASDASELVENRRSVALNVNKNDAKLRHNRCVNFLHFAIIAGTGNLVLGNHFWQDDPEDPGERTAGLILTERQSKTAVTGNYIDNMFVELTNEHQTNAANTNGQPFGSVTFSGNIWTGTKIPNWFRFIVLTPLGNNHRIEGLNVVANAFELFGGAQIDRVEGIDDSLGTFDLSQTRDLVWEGNSYVAIDVRTASPALIEVTRSSAAATWTADASDLLPFGGQALGVDNVTAHGPIRTSNGNTLWTTPYVEVRQGAQNNLVNLKWSQAARGTVQMKVRVDRP